MSQIQSVSNAKSLHFLDDGSDFYRYTAGCWRFNEYQQLQTRYVRFRISSLAAIAARRVGHVPASSSESRNCRKEISISAFSIPWLMDLKSSRESNPNSGIPHYTTDSEVVMIDFVCACPNTLLLSCSLILTVLR